MAIAGFPYCLSRGLFSRGKGYFSLQVKGSGFVKSSCRRVLSSTSIVMDQQGKKSSNSSDNHIDNEDRDKETQIEPDLVLAAENVAKVLPGEAVQTQSDLLKQLRAHVVLVKHQKAGHRETPLPNMRDLFSGMKIDRQRFEQSRAAFGRDPVSGPRRGPRWKEASSPVKGSIPNSLLTEKGLWSQGLGIFTQPLEASNQKTLESSVARERTLWDEVDEEMLIQIQAFPPPNAFEEMIQWTKQGKLWTFPINNETGMEEEAKIGFHEHVFLDPLIEDFPKAGPIRHFMELVITGMSKNPYLTVQQKKDHVQWFREYFREKRQIVDEMIQKHS